MEKNDSIFAESLFLAWIDSDSELDCAEIRRRSWKAVPVVFSDEDKMDYNYIEWLYNALFCLKSWPIMIGFSKIPEIKFTESLTLPEDYDQFMFLFRECFSYYRLITNPNQDYMIYLNWNFGYYIICGPEEFLKNAFPASYDTAKDEYFFRARNDLKLGEKSHFQKLWDKYSEFSYSDGARRSLKDVAARESSNVIGPDVEQFASDFVSKVLDADWMVDIEFIRANKWSTLLLPGQPTFHDAELLSDACGLYGNGSLIGISFFYIHQFDARPLRATGPYMPEYLRENSWKHVVLTNMATEYLVFQEEEGDYYLLCGDIRFIHTACRCSYETARAMFFEYAVREGSPKFEEGMTKLWEKYSSVSF